MAVAEAAVLDTVPGAPYGTPATGAEASRPWCRAGSRCTRAQSASERRTRRRRRRRIQRRLQPRVAQVVRQWPGHSRLPCPPDIAADRAVGEVWRMAPISRWLQPGPYFSRRTSRIFRMTTSSGPPSSSSLKVLSRGWKNGSLLQVIQHPPYPLDYNPLASQPRRKDGASKWTTCVGMGGRNASECAGRSAHSQMPTVEYALDATRSRVI